MEKSKGKRSFPPLWPRADGPGRELCRLRFLSLFADGKGARKTYTKQNLVDEKESRPKSPTLPGAAVPP
jgi:hypothetical protein